MAQLRVVPLEQDPLRYPRENPTTPRRSVFRREGVVVQASISISMVSGNNPRCTGASSQFASFRASVTNGGANPQIVWYLNNASVGSGLYWESAEVPSDATIQAALISTLPCVAQSEVKSNTIVISQQDSLEASARIVVLKGNLPTCSSRDTLTFGLSLQNMGLQPTISWYQDTISDATLVSNGMEYVAATLTVGGFVQAIVKPSAEMAACVRIAEDTTTRTFKIVQRNLLPSFSIVSSAYESERCDSVFTRIDILNPKNMGNTPKYIWYLNSSAIATTTSSNFSVYLPSNGAEIYTVGISSLSCANPASASSPSILRTDTLSLPFWDDFSQHDLGGQPSTQRWLPREGVYVNNQYPVNPPNFNAATFDGLKYDGSPYDTLSNTSRGTTDRLTSLPIDLQDKAACGLVFWWQPAGRGEAPDSSQGDYLTCEFKNSSGSWVEVWKAGGRASQPFSKVLVAIPVEGENNFYHKGFQFRFTTTGRRSGAFDVFHLDYVFLQVLAEGDASQNTFFLDQSFVATPSPLLKDMHSLPLDWIKENPTRYLSDSLVTSYRNLSSEFNNNAFSIEIRTFEPYSEGRLLSTVFTNTSIRIDPSEEPVKLAVPIDTVTLPWQQLQAPLILHTKCMLANDGLNTDQKGLDYRQNNTLSGYTILDNYAAYDDGTAEYGAALNQSQAVVAYKFYTPRKDTLEEIAISFTKLNKVLLNQTFILMVMKNLPVGSELNNPSSDKPSVLYRQSETLRYGGRNGFTVYPLSAPVVVQDSFYIAIQQITDDQITIGWDVNTSTQHLIFSTENGQWIPYSDPNFQGSLMIRPVFGKYRYVTGIPQVHKPKSQARCLSLYPNPTSDLAYLEEEAELAEVYAIRGERVWSRRHTDVLDLGALPNGMYIVRAHSREGRLCTYKLILQK